MPTQDRERLPTEQLLLLWAARRSGALDALLESAGTPADVAETADVTLHAARVTVGALEAMGFLERVGTEYEITNRALGFLAKRDVRSIGRLPHALDLLDLSTELPETMATGSSPERPPNWTRNRLGAHAATDEADVRACVTAAVREYPGTPPARVLDVAGGSGVYAREFVARGFDVTLVDDRETVDVVSPLLAPTSVDLVATDLPSLAALGSDGASSPVEQVDLVFGVDVLRRFAARENESLVAETADVLAPGGTLVLADVFDGQRADAAETVRIAVEALATGDGGLYDERTVRAWFEDAGLVDVAVRSVPGTDRRAVVGHVPTGSE
ncbi:Methyltransferase domain-containing protein [Halogranum amylolyticum]|uniref:Methyltransferase domain-containing protein n=1 Tax=Halogranum amylolyticum TaxID=660520 RepID=A0A1H8VY36_9EURY|nr:methyltransferase domain-containing protein [Halogranum amylolyticum]SEP20309.1 Methyltransferase domain-containing protein [Halogranum amylolyticum]